MVFEDPMGYVGIEKGSDKVTLVFCQDGQEIHICMGPLQTLTIAQQGALYAHKLLEQNIQVIEDCEKAHDDCIMIDRECPPRLDS